MNESENHCNAFQADNSNPKTDVPIMYRIVMHNIGRQEMSHTQSYTCVYLYNMRFQAGKLQSNALNFYTQNIYFHQVNVYNYIYVPY